MTFLIQTPTQLSAHLRALRTAKGLSQEQLGIKLGLSQTRIARIEKNPLNVSVAQILKVLIALDATLAVVVRPTLIDLPIICGLDANAKSNQGDW